MSIDINTVDYKVLEIECCDFGMRGICPMCGFEWEYCRCGQIDDLCSCGTKPAILKELENYNRLNKHSEEER